MDYFLKIFGDISVGKAAMVIGAMVFLVAVYKKVEKYFSDKVVRDMEKDERIQQVIDQADQYPKWHQQSIDIRDRLNDIIEDLAHKLDGLNDSLDELKRESSEGRATTCRYRILRFDDEIRHDEYHTKEHFDQILEDITEYEKYCNGHPDYRNNKAVMAIENIKRVYQQCSSEGNFL